MIPLMVGAAISAGGAIAKSISGAIRSRKMQDAINSYDRQDLTNVYRNRVGVSRLGADQQTEELARNTATSMDALAMGGVRGMVGGIGRVQQNANNTQRQISSDLDRQQQRIDMAAAQDDARIRQMQEQREQADLAGMGRELNAARQDLWGGIGDIGQIAMASTGMFGAGAGQAAAGGMSQATTNAMANPNINTTVPIPTAGNSAVNYQAPAFNPMGPMGTNPYTQFA